MAITANLSLQNNDKCCQARCVDRFILLFMYLVCLWWDLNPPSKGCCQKSPSNLHVLFPKQAMLACSFFVSSRQEMRTQRQRATLHHCLCPLAARRLPFHLSLIPPSLCGFVICSIYSLDVRFNSGIQFGVAIIYINKEKKSARWR